MTIRIVITGGTFDKEYNELTGKLFFTGTHMDQILKLGRSELKTKVSFLMLIDSSFMKNTHRKKILNECSKVKESKIVITHGTDTMVKTAKFLAKSKNLKNKTIVLTGAMIPYSFGTSDGLFNMGAALAFVQSLPSGVYIAMNGKYFPWNDCVKNVKTGKFEKL